MILSHLCNIDIERLIKEDAILLILGLGKTACLMLQQVFNVAVHLYNRDCCIINKGYLADPFVLEFLLKLLVYLCKYILRVIWAEHVFHPTSSYRMRCALVCNDDQINIRPWQAQLRGM